MPKAKRKLPAIEWSGDYWKDYLSAMHLVAPGELSSIPSVPSVAIPRVPRVVIPRPVVRPRAVVAPPPPPEEGLSPDQEIFIDRLARKFGNDIPEWTSKFRKELKECLPDGKKLNEWCKNQKKELGVRELTVLKTFYDAADGLRDPEVCQIREDCENFMANLGVTDPEIIKGINPNIR